MAGAAVCSTPQRTRSLLELLQAWELLVILVTSQLKSCSHVIDEKLDPLPFFLQQEHFSHHFPTCHSRTELWPIPSYLPFWGTEGFYKDPFWISFQKCSIQQQFLDLPLLTWKKSIVILTSLSHGYRVISIYVFSECNFHPHWLCVSSS